MSAPGLYRSRLRPHPQQRPHARPVAPAFTAKDFPCRSSVPSGPRPASNLTVACSSGSTTASSSSSETPAAAASSAPTGSAAEGSAADAPATTGAETLRLGYFPNVTHASAVLGVKNGTFQKALGDTKLETTTFNAGPAAIESLLSGAIDATFIGPNPAINAFVKSNGQDPGHPAARRNPGCRLAQVVAGQRVEGSDHRRR